jgi:ABC-type Na+ efflux pump permease subunit
VAAGPIFYREALTVPRQIKHYLIRSGYLFALLVLLYTTSQATFGWQVYRSPTALAQFGELVFQIFALIQLTLALAVSLVFAAGNVSLEKDRKTLVLLLVTDLRDRELVLGKLAASILQIAVLQAVSIPIFMMLTLLGGTTLQQVLWVSLLTFTSSLLAGSWGTLVAFWKEKTFQTLAYGLLGLVVLIGGVEIAALFLNPASPVTDWGLVMNPYRALFRILAPFAQTSGTSTIGIQAWDAVIVQSVMVVVMNVFTIFMLRVWNPSRVTYQTIQKEKDLSEKTQAARNVWSQPILWREMMTRAYGRQMIYIKLGYLAIAGLTGYGIYQLTTTGDMGGDLILGMISLPGFLLILLSLLSMMLVNSQAVTAITTERDGGTLELLLVTNITAREFILGKLGGVFYNLKEAILAPIAIVWLMFGLRTLTTEAAVLLTLGYLVLIAFSAMTGLHSGLTYPNSRRAISTSLGTMFFLFIGIFICMLLIVEARSSFALQLPSFLLFILGGSIGLWLSLTYRNPSPALTITAAILPFLTFYAITAFLLGGSLDVFLSISFAYGFAITSMLVPAISEFDIAIGRQNAERR